MPPAGDLPLEGPLELPLGPEPTDDEPPDEEPPLDELPAGPCRPLVTPPLDDELPAGGIPIEVGIPTDGIEELVGKDADKQPKSDELIMNVRPMYLTIFMLMPPLL